MEAFGPHRAVGKPPSGCGRPTNPLGEDDLPARRQVVEVAHRDDVVDLLDEGKIPDHLGYVDLYHRVRRTLDSVHAEGRLKAEIMADPGRFVQLDADVPLALLDQKNSGKKLMLITNSEWQYTQRMMGYAFDRFLPAGTTWRVWYL